MEESTMTLILLVLGTCLSASILYLVFVTIKTIANGPTVSSISIAGFLVALATFCISTPKINGLVLKLGENYLELSKLNNEIKNKKSELALVDAKIIEKNLVIEANLEKKGTATQGIASTQSHLPSNSNLRSSILEIMSKNKNGFAVTPEYVAVDNRSSLFAVIGQSIKMKPTEVIVFQKKSNPIQLLDTASIVDKNNKSYPKDIKISDQLQKTILNSLIELDSANSNHTKDIKN